MTRRDARWGTLMGSASVTGLLGDPGAAASLLPRNEMRKAVVFGMLPSSMPIADRFKLARDCGFDGVEAYTLTNQQEVDAMRQAVDQTGLKVHSIMNQAHWKHPLSSGDAEQVRASMEGMQTSLRNARDLGADTVLLVPAVVDAQTRYIEAYLRSQQRIRELIPLAEGLGVVIAIENVWNKFLLSPLEFARYVDDFNTPHVAAYFDVGNVVLYGYPQDWIRTLGDRIKKVHVKDFKVDRQQSRWQWTNLYDGEVNWDEVRKALGEIGYSGWLTAELGGGDEAYLRDVAKRMDRIIGG